MDAEWLATLRDAAGAALLGIDLEGHTVFWSLGAEALFGWTAGEILGRVPPIVPLALRQEWQLQMQRVFETGAPAAAAETQRIARDGRSIPVLRTSWPVFDAAGHVVGLLDLLVDITGLKQIDEESRAMAQVRERELISMDLHDGLIQALYALVLGLAAQEQALGPAQMEAARALKTARRDIEGVIEETRRYVANLRAREFVPRSLEPGLRLLADSLRLNAGVAVQLRFAPDVEQLLKPDVRGHLLYLAREAVSNVLRHAAATRVKIELARWPESIVLSVTDNGRGFDQGRLGATASTQRGLRNMAERARLVGGRLAVQTRPGSGTRIRLELPL
jgi:PAS domain S-box-containing protein